MQKQRLKIWVLPAQRGKKSFGTVWDNTVSILRQGLLLHCSARCTKALLALPNDNECQIKNVLAHDFVYRSFLRPEGQNQSTGDTFCNARRDSNPRASSLTGSRSKCSSGIHFGISSCTAVKDWLKHRLEVTLQAYFTILFTVFHGKKAAKTHGACNFSINWTNICAVLKYSSRFEQPRFASENGIFPKASKKLRKQQKSPQMRAFSLF